VGVNGGGTLRRALVRFDLSSIPAGSRILSVGFRAYMSQTNSGSHNCALHRMLEPWGGQAGGPADLNGDGIVGGADLTVVLTNWSA